MAQKLDLKIKGLYLNPNNLSEVPPGALFVANNIVIDKESIAESRRGQKTYGNQLATGSGEINKLFNYRNALVTHYDNKLAYDSNNTGNWMNYSGTYENPDVGYKMRSLEANRNFYFTTSQGIYKLDSISATPRPAGAYKGLDGYGLTTGSAGFMANNVQVAYRIVWGYKDRNNNLILGAPSQRVIVANSSGGTRDVELHFTIPTGVTSDWLYQIYRSGASAGITEEPNDELQLVIENNPSQAQITALELVTTDTTPNDLRGAALYTNPNQQGIANANETPPYAKDMDVYKDHTFYGNVKSKGRLYVTFVSVDTPSFGYYTDATTGTTSGSPNLTTIASTTDLRVGMRIIGAGIPVNTYIKSILSGTSVEMTQNASATASVSVEFQDRLTVDGVDYFGGSSQNIATNQFEVYTAGTPAENIDNTAFDFTEVVNKSASNTTIYAYYISGYNDLPGKILFEERIIGGANFQATSTYGDAFNPVLPTENYITGNTIANPTVVTSIAHDLVDGDEVIFYESNSVPSLNGLQTVTVTGVDTFTVPVNCTSSGTTGYWVKAERVVESDNDEKANRVFISKPKQPEAVPLFTFLDVGSADAPILRLIALRDSVFVFKTDGIFRITGEDLSTFRVSLFDSTATLKAPESAVAFNNQVCTFSDQGIIAVSDNGVQVLSRPIESTLLELSAEQYTNFESSTFAVSYESSRQYMLFTVTEEDDTYCTQAFVYNSFTNSWTRWIMDRSCGIVNKRDNKLYMGHPTNDYVYQERKDFDTSDYADEEYAVNIVSSDGFTVTLTSTSVVQLGYTLKQGGRESVVESIDGNILTLDKSLSWFVGAANVFKPILTEVQWVPADIENPGILKQFREITLLFRDAAFNSAEVSFSTNFATDPTVVTIVPQAVGAWGTFPWGTVKWGGGVGGQQPIRTYVPLDKQRAVWLNVAVSSEQAFTSFSLAGISIQFNPMSERFK